MPRFNLTFAVDMSQWLDKCVLSFLPWWQQKSFEQRKTEQWDTSVCVTFLIIVTEHMAYLEGMLKMKIPLDNLLCNRYANQAPTFWHSDPTQMSFCVSWQTPN